MVVAVFALSACGAGGSPQAEEQVQQIGRATATSLPQEGVRHVLYSHCGIVSTTFDGALWLADPPLGADSHNPPAGWGENDTPGLFVKRTATESTFQGDSGVEANFIKATASASDPAAYCE